MNGWMDVRIYVLMCVYVFFAVCIDRWRDGNPVLGGRAQI